MGHAVADHLDEVQHVEVAVNLEFDRAAAFQHAAAAAPAPREPDVATTKGMAASTCVWERTRMPNILNRIGSRMGSGLLANVIVRKCLTRQPTRLW